MRKAYLSLALAVFSSSILVNGCIDEKIQVIHNGSVVTNSVPTRAFNDESYVWENWTIGTNKVNIVY